MSRFIWVPGRVNLAGPGTKPGNPHTDALLLTFLGGRLSLDFPSAESCDLYLSLGYVGFRKRGNMKHCLLFGVSSH